MAIRVRVLGGRTIAVCAVESDPKVGDLYLDDAIHEALAAKFMRDWRNNGIIPGGPLPSDPIVDGENVRDAESVLIRALHDVGVD